MLLAVCASPAAAAPRVAFGAFTPDAPWNRAPMDAFAKKVGRMPVLWSTYRNWGETPAPRDTLQNVDDVGAVTIVSWHPYGANLRAVARGDDDAYLRDAARDAADWGKPFFIRFAPEMNLDFFEWGVPAHYTAGQYIAAWRHIVDVFRANGADNVRWVWNPNVGQFDGMYPGDRWVDWMALDGYNWGSYYDTWDSFDDIYASSYRAMTKLSDKPIMVAEFASNESGGDKAAWIRDALSRSTLERYPRIHAYNWFNINKETDWRVDSSSATLSAFRSMIQTPLFDLDRAGLLAIGADPAPGATDAGTSPDPAPAPETTSTATGGKRLRCGLYPRKTLRALWDVPVPLRCARSPRVNCTGVATIRQAGTRRWLGTAEVDLWPGRRRGVRIGLGGWVDTSLRSVHRLRARITLRTSSRCRGGGARQVVMTRP
jgi:hypothetical protein